MYNDLSDLSDLLDFLSNQECFIEAEALQDAMTQFIIQYNNDFNENLPTNLSFSDRSKGLIVLNENADKWGVELRLYVYNCPDDIKTKYGFTKSRAYRPEYSYRLNNNKIIKELFKNGYRIGLNQ